jgi:hypothetical protein
MMLLSWVTLLELSAAAPRQQQIEQPRYTERPAELTAAGENSSRWQAGSSAAVLSQQLIEWPQHTVRPAELADAGEDSSRWQAGSSAAVLSQQLIE